MFRRGALLLVTLMFAHPASASAQTVFCNFQGDSVSNMDMGGGVTILLLQSPFVATCDDGTELRANSGQVNQSVGEMQLVGDVFFRDVTRRLTADDATYNRETGRLYAHGNVVLVDETEERRTLSGPELEYFRENETRPEALVYATQRSTLVMEQRPAADDTTAAEPLTLVGDRIDIVGSNDLTAVGNVVLTQADLTATAEEARYDATGESLELRLNARIEKEAYSLLGQVIQAQLSDGALQHIHSRTAARLDGEDLVVAAPDIQLFFVGDTLQQVIAKVTPDEVEQRARAASRTFRVEADSVDAMFDAGVLTTVYAIGAARGETVDTTLAGADARPLLPMVAVEASTVPQLSVDSSDVVQGGAAVQEPVGAQGGEVAGNAAADGPPVEPGGGAGSGGAGPSPEMIRSVTESDWIRGDTIIAYFVTGDSAGAPISPSESSLDAAEESGTELSEGETVAAPADDPAVEERADPVVAECGAEPCPEDPTGEEDDSPQLRRLVARREAQSLYRLASERGSNPACRDLSFLVGAEIELDVVNGELEVANVIGLEQGFYLEATNCAPPPAPGDPSTDETTEEAEEETGSETEVQDEEAGESDAAALTAPSTVRESAMMTGRWR